MSILLIMLLYHRKSYVINPRLFYPITEAILEKPGLFNRKRIQAYNNSLMEDYRDKVRAQKEFIDSLTPEQSHYVLEQSKRDPIMFDVMK